MHCCSAAPEIHRHHSCAWQDPTSHQLKIKILSKIHNAAKNCLLGGVTMQLSEPPKLAGLMHSCREGVFR